MAILDGGEKFVVGLVMAVLIVFGIVTLRSQIKYDAPFAAFGDITKRVEKVKTEKPKHEDTTAFKPNATVNANVNFRPAPTTDNTPMKVLSAGTKVFFISESDGWARIKDETGTEGYVGYGFLNF